MGAQAGGPMLASYLRLVKGALALSCALPLVSVLVCEMDHGSAGLPASLLVQVASVGSVAFLVLVRSYARSARIALASLAAVLLAGAAVSRIDFGSGLLVQFATPELALLALAGSCVAAGLWRLLSRCEPQLAALSGGQAEFLDRLHEPYVNGAILASAALSLFLELSVIRWQTSMFEFFAYYKNFSLLACFAGLGLGYALADRREIPLILVIPLLAWQMALLMFLRWGLPPDVLKYSMTSPIREQLNMGFGSGSQASLFGAVYLYLGAVFLLTALGFIPVGQLCGRLMTRRPNLRAYGLNLLGSLLGVALTLAVSYLWTPPAIWFALGFGGLAFYQAFERRATLAASLTGIAAIVVLAWPAAPLTELIYSPYQLLERTQGENGYMMVKAAGHYYQKVADLSLANANRRTDPLLKAMADYYEFPYKVRGKPGRVAVVGAGTGNDVAAALRMDAERVDAIEIDPAILKLGRAYHPEQPYANPAARAIVNDARTFLRTTDETYDMVVYGLLDSHSLLSHASSVRLDSFVYTVEGLREARARLHPAGVLSLSFCVLSPELGRKIYLMMQEAFEGHPPICIVTPYDRSVIYLQNREGNLELPRGLLEETGFHSAAAFYGDAALRADVSTDDWPFFYMPRRIYPVSYLGVFGLIVFLSLLLVANFSTAKPPRGAAAFFLMGAGFMLIETKAVTELGLTFGNTWQVIGVAIAGILLMGYLANAAVARWSVKNPIAPFILLVLTLAAGFAVARGGGFSSSASGRGASVLLLTGPMLFSGIVFSALLATSRELTGAMAFNLLGAMCGGLLEYTSMYFGFRFLYLLAIVLYLLALLSLVASVRRAGRAQSGFGDLRQGLS